MHKIIEFLKRINTPLALSIVLIIFGLSFVLLPEGVLDIAVAVIGAILLTFGIVLFATSGGSDGAVSRPSRRDTALSVAIAIGGLALITMQSGVSVVICRVLGTVMLIYSALNLYKFNKTHPERDGAFWWETITSSIIILLGAWLGFFPSFPRLMSGIALIAVGIKMLIGALRPPKRGSSDGAKGDYYTDDFEDKS